MKISILMDIFQGKRGKICKKICFISLTLIFILLMLASSVYGSAERRRHIRLVNESNRLRSSFVPNNLVNIRNVRGFNSSFIDTRQTIHLERTAAEHLIRMLTTANREAGHQFFITSGYRSFAEQRRIVGGGLNAIRNAQRTYCNRCSRS